MSCQKATSSAYPVRLNGKKLRQHLKSEPKGPTERDIQIDELHKADKTARDFEEMFGISESKVREIYWAMKKHVDKGR